MKVRDFLTVSDLSKAELTKLFALAAKVKRARLAGRRVLAGKTIALVFQKPSMRTRVAFEVAVLELGGSVIYLGQDDIRLGQREPICDVAQVLSRYVHGIVVRTFAHADAEEFAERATVPVINGLSDLVHPCQALADLFTIQEAYGTLKGVRLAYVGDGNNVLHSLIQAAALFGMKVTVATPNAYKPDAKLWRDAAAQAERSGGSLFWTAQPRSAAAGAQVLYTDVWVSMGQEAEKAKRLKEFQGYQVNGDLLQVAAPGCKVLHCLPAHRGEEISAGVMDSRQSLIIDQAENRMHVQKALLMMLFQGARA